MSSKQRVGLTHSEAGKLGYIKSKEKLDAYYNKFKEQYYNNPKLCKNCNSVIDYSKRGNSFCNHSCRATFVNKRRIRSDARRLIGCLYCGKKTKNTKYCSSKCQKDRDWKIKKESFIQAGKIIANNDTCIRRYGRKFLIETNGYKCFKCGLSKWMGREISLNIHHIDGDSTNNKFDNLQLLCLNCHGQTENYGSRNKNGTRKYRRKK